MSLRSSGRTLKSCNAPWRENERGDTPPRKVENNYLAACRAVALAKAELSGVADGEAGPVRRSPQGEGGRKAKMLARKGDNVVFGLFEFDFAELRDPPPPGGVCGIPKNNSQQFAQPNLSRPKTRDGLLAPLRSRD